MILVDKNFYKSVPSHCRIQIEKRIKRLIKEMEANKNIINELSAGFYCRKINGVCNRYKFRVSDGDRVIFCYDAQRNVVLLRYCMHDEQIRIAKNLQAVNIETNDYQDDEFDAKIDNDIREEYEKLVLAGNINEAKEKLLDTKYGKRVAKICKIDDFKDVYSTQGYDTCGITIHTDGKRPLTREDLKYAFNRLNSEYHVVPAQYLIVYIVGSAIYMPVIVEQDFSIKYKNDYIEACVEAVFAKIGILTEWSKLVIETAFYRYDAIWEGRHNFRIDCYNRKLDVSPFSIFNIDGENTSNRMKPMMFGLLRTHSDNKVAKLNLDFVLN